MIISLDAMLASMLVALTASTFLQASGNFDFSVKEVASQKFADSLALALQEQKILLIQLKEGNGAELEQQIENIRGNYCIVVKSGSEVVGNCMERQKVSRNFFVYENGEFLEGSVLVYFD